MWPLKAHFYRHRKNYALTFSDAQGAFTVEAHLEQLNTFQAQAYGLDIAQMNLEALCSNPKEGNPRIKHDMRATISPDFMGLAGTFMVRARPESRYLAEVKAVGVKLYGSFEESASSAANDMETWTRRRKVVAEDQSNTIGEAGSWRTATVSLKIVERPTDELDPLSVVHAEVIAAVGTLEKGDLLSHPTHGTYHVRGISPEGAYERARIEK